MESQKLFAEIDGLKEEIENLSEKQIEYENKLSILDKEVSVTKKLFKVYKKNSVDISYNGTKNLIKKKKVLIQAAIYNIEEEITTLQGRINSKNVDLYFYKFLNEEIGIVDEEESIVPESTMAPSGFCSGQPANILEDEAEPFYGGWATTDSITNNSIIKASNEPKRIKLKIMGEEVLTHPSESLPSTYFQEQKQKYQTVKPTPTQTPKPISLISKAISLISKARINTEEMTYVKHATLDDFYKPNSEFKQEIERDNAVEVNSENGNILLKTHSSPIVKRTLEEIQEERNSVINDFHNPKKESNDSKNYWSS